MCAQSWSLFKKYNYLSDIFCQDVINLWIITRLVFVGLMKLSIRVVVFIVSLKGGASNNLSKKIKITNFCITVLLTHLKKKSSH